MLSELVGEKQVGAMKEFAVSHASTLHRTWLNLHLAQANPSQHPEIASPLTGNHHWQDVWSNWSGQGENVVRVWLQPYEQTNILEVIKTDNNLYNKITSVFASLADEIDHLIHTVRHAKQTTKNK